MAKRKNRNKKQVVKQTTVPKVEQTATLVDRPKLFGDHPSKGLTPRKLHTILEDAERGDIVAQSELFTDIKEKDSHIFSEMSKRERALLTLDWRIAKPKDATPAEEQLAEEVEAWVDRLPNLEDLVLNLMDALGHGFSALEVQWQYDEGNNLRLPKSLIYRPQHWFMFTEDGELKLRDGSDKGADLWPLNWVVHTHKSRAGIVQRAGLMRTLVWLYVFKNYSVGDFAEFLETYGLPIRLGKYAPGTGEDDKRALLNAVRNIGHDAAGIIPDGVEILFQSAASGSHEPFMGMTDWCEKSMSKVILGGTLTSQADGKTSTNALGNVHNEVRHDLLAGDAKQIAATITNQIILPLIQINKGSLGDVRLPWFEFDTQQPEDIVIYADAIPKLVAMGMQIQVSWAHEKLGIPQASKDEAILGAVLPGQAALNSGHYRQVALSKAGEVLPIEQIQLDDVIQNLDPNLLNEVIAPIAKQLMDGLSEGRSPDDVIDIMSELYPDIDDQVLQAALTKAIWLAEVWGRISGQ